MVFRVFDHVLATGVDAIFSFSVLLLQKNERALLNMNFDQILEFLKTSLLDRYKVDSSSNSASVDTPADLGFDRSRRSWRMGLRRGFVSMISFGMLRASELRPFS